MAEPGADGGLRERDAIADDGGARVAGGGERAILRRSDIDTPALLVDVPTLEGNIARVAETCRRAGVNWRPHVKSHKSPDIARMLIAAGASGLTCAKLGEAEVLAPGVTRDILISGQIVGPAKIERLLRLSEHADAIVAVDCAGNARELAGPFRRGGKVLDVVIEVDIGMRRAGVLPGEAVVELANAIADEAGLRLRGVMAWESHALTFSDPLEKEQVVRRSLARLTESAGLCREAGHAVDIVSCGGTGTFPYCCEAPGVTEVQVGGGILSDNHYRDHFHVPFPPAITLMATVISRPTPNRVVLDAGKKAMSGDAALPTPLGLPDVASVHLAAEHAIVELRGAHEAPRVGDRVEFVLGYCDTTIHLHENLIAMRNGVVEAVWPVAARGKVK
ncbi:MAG: DSD1 family PLP-dependent enzyme [Flavobacteriaceae bacterium]